VLARVGTAREPADRCGRLASDCVVAVDLAMRTVTVMPAETGYSALLWREGYEKLIQAERSGRYGAPAVWARDARWREVARGEPEGGALKFTFRRGDPAWGRLVGTPGLRATFTVDRTSKQIMGVTFRGRDHRPV
jgi:hypothetical protein